MANIQEIILPPLSKEEETKLFEIGSSMARDTIIRAQGGFVLIMAQRFSQTSSIGIEELFSAGMVGVCKSFDHFKPNNGTRFLSYARKEIRNQMIEEIRSRRVVHIPSNALKDIERMNANTEDGDPNISATRRLYAGWYKNYSEGQIIGDRHIVQPEASNIRTVLKLEKIKNGYEEILKDISPKSEVDILRKYLTGKYTFREIGEPLGLSRQRIEQICKKIMRKIQPRLSKFMELNGDPIHQLIALNEYLEMAKCRISPL